MRERVLALRDQGLRPGQVVLCPDTPVIEPVAMSLALMQVGAALLPYRTGLPGGEILELAASTGAEWRWSPDSATLIPLEPATGTASPCPGSLGSALALLVKTSGSSGGPKVVMLTRENLIASAAAVNRRLGFGSDDVWLCCLRLSHIGGLSIIHRWALAGGSLVLHEGFDAQAVAEDLQRHAVTHISLVPPMLGRLIDTGAAPPPSLRVVLVGGQALSPVLAERALLAGWPLFLTYGMTETTSQIATSAHALERVPSDGRVGPLLPGVEIDRRDGLEGPSRLRVRGPMVMAGYANPGRLAGQGLDEGWFETSDLGGIDAEGELRVVGRADDVLVIGGNNISLTRVDGLLRAAPGVSDLAVVALADAIWGHRLVVVYTGDLDERAFERWCDGALSGAERPRVFKRVAGLPLLDSGKYDRIAIRALALESGSSP
ncbi:AMP-binding protein [Thiocapsa roseopersicina]|uniref:O-succinylbenzoic acid--CoA ligase n=1 Tax=Thiocapsa roseopersicina TaxID=1058 RepID=A0A1H2YJS5_THIRO|nr:AMP-binding protein [Thiocapsa roseopersicina]SDX05058.1 O-succinylbenzoic acid--CoA ligase [Thiocapsa roseopersicina]